MRVIKNRLFYFGLLVLLEGCVEPFDPVITEAQDILVIHGQITDQEGYQYVEISRSSGYNNPIKKTVSGCLVQIIDDKENVFVLDEMGLGQYACWMCQEDLTIGSTYKLLVTTPNGKQYHSEYDTLLACPPIDEIHYERMTKETDNYTVYDGFQFYVSTNTSGNYTKNYRWKLTETWKYHSKYKISLYYDGTIREGVDDPFEFFYCWRTLEIPEIFTYSTKSLTSGIINKLPINYVTYELGRLSMKYSLNVKQCSLSDMAFNYWNTLQQLSQESGGLYETQPVQLQGNIYNLDDPEENVLGLFYASSVQEKRIFVDETVGNYSPDCNPWKIPQSDFAHFLRSFSPSQYPIYLITAPWGTPAYTDQYCFDCRLSGGTTTKPDFWE